MTTDIVLLADIVLLVVALTVAYVVLGGFFSGAGYQPVPRTNLETMFEFAQPDETETVYDLGSGFGRIVIEVARRFKSRCVGVEVDGLKVWWTRRRARVLGLQDRVTIIKGNLLQADISKADVVFVFLWDGIMQKLKTKVLAEMKPGALVVSYYHQFHGWEPERQDKAKRVYAYRVPPRA